MGDLDYFDGEFQEKCAETIEPSGRLRAPRQNQPPKRRNWAERRCQAITVHDFLCSRYAPAERDGRPVCNFHKDADWPLKYGPPK